MLHRSVLRPLHVPAVLARRLGVAAPRGVVLWGAPAVGKTAFANALAREISKVQYSLSVGDLARGEVGESEKLIADVFARARVTRPCAVVVDDIDVLFGRDHGGGQGAGAASAVGTGIVSQLVLEMDGAPPGVVVVATTVDTTKVVRCLVEVYKQRSMLTCARDYS